jgi:RNA polymerase sigma factor (sigma-70 family)
MKNNKVNTTDIELWTLFKEGDQEALKIIYHRYFKHLYNYGRKFSTDKELVEDCIQDLYIDLINKKEKLGNTNNILLYLLKSIKRRIIRKLQQEQKTVVLNFDLFEYPGSESAQQNNSKIREKLIQAINKLSPQQREIIYLKYFNFLGNKEIAEILDVSYQTVRNVLVTALKKLRKLMGIFTFLLVVITRKTIISKNI